MGKIKIFFIIFCVVFGFFISEEVRAGAADNVSGWAWSENIGWISFNCNNPELPAPRCTNNYGVNINPSTGAFSGYAWSENIGWITFNESELTGCPTVPCRARLDFGTKQVSGWAKALTDGGGWDGWLRLRDSNYGVSWNSSTQEMEGWAWSDMVIGWVSFNCKDTGVCATSDYKVIFRSISCSVSVPDSQVINEPISINVSGSQGAITGVRFASDNILNGVRDGSWDPVPPNYYDWNTSSGNWNATSKTMKWSFANPGNYEVWAEVKDGAGNTRACYDTILILECYPGQTKTCTSPQGCSHTLTCKPDGTWPSCPTDVCTASTQDSILCPCPAVDGCVGNDYYDYPAYGDCNSSCNCDVGTAPGQPCAPTIYLNDPRCVGVDQCNSDADCDDGNPCTNNWCERPADPDSVCLRDNLAAGISCGTCRQCDGNGNCVNRPDGYDTSECGTGCQRCLFGFCQDYHQACAGTEVSCECWSDSCIDCSNYYGESCGYRGVCYCGPAEKPVWSCSNWQCQCLCQSDPSCEWEPDEYPEVVISPSSQEGNPGDELSYEVTIINPSEEEVTWTITASVPSSWSYQLDSQELITVTIEPGQSTNLSFKAKPPEDASSGEYDISIIAQNEQSGEGFTKYVIPNQPPRKPGIPEEYSPTGVSWDHCSVPALSIPTFHWTYSDPEDVPPGTDPQTACEIRIDDDKSFFDGDELIGFGGASPSFTPSTPDWRDWEKRDWNTNYWWIVKVKDSNGNWSHWSDPTQFTTPLHAAPSPDFNLSKERVSQNEVVTATDTSLCYTFPGNLEVNCRDLVGTGYEWDFDYDGSFDSVKTTKGNTTWVYSDLGQHTVVLRITDDIATCYSEAKTLTVTLPLPKWKEIAPF